MTAKSPTPMPKNIQRPGGPNAPPKFSNTVTVQVEIKREPKYPVYAFDMWMLFDNQSDYLDWQDGLEYRK
jgi:hypothetical protein